LKNKRDKDEINKQTIEAFVVESDSDGDILLATSSEKGSAFDCILGYGCTYHMYPHKDWF